MCSWILSECYVVSLFVIFLGGNGLLGYSAIPLTFIIKDGKVIDKNVGSIDYTEFTTQLKELQ